MKISPPLSYLWCFLFLQESSIHGFAFSPLFIRTATTSLAKDSRMTRPALFQSNYQVTDQEDSNVLVLMPRSRLIDRREAILLSLLFGACSLPPLALAAETMSSTTTKTTVASNTFAAPVTQKVFMNVRISRSDGTFYVRDEEENDDDKVLYARLVIGLFGTVAPVNVQRFLSYIPGTTSSTKKSNNDEDDLEDMLSLPSYAQSSFPSLDQGTGLLNAGVIPALHVTEFNGAAALQYGGRLLPAPLWLETSSLKSVGTSSSTTPSTARVSHSAARGLLTHRQLDVTPAFQITTRIIDPDTAKSLDATNVVFGQVVLWDPMDPSALAFFRRLQDIPTYSASRPAPSSSLDEDSAVIAVTSSLYRAQRDFFRGAAQTLGDQRLANIYEGKFLRRVEVTQIGLLDA